MTIPCNVIGCDVSKDRLDLHDWQAGKDTHIANTPTAISRWLGTLDTGTVCVVFEATAPYDGALGQALETAGITAYRVNPAQARHFAKSMGYLAKTDTLDARMLAQMCVRLDLRPSPIMCPQRRRLQALSRRRDQLVEMRKQERTRLKQAGDDIVCTSLKASIDRLTSEIGHIEAVIAELVDNTPDMADAYALITSIPGIGKVTAAILIGLMPELGTIPRRKISALAGLAPINNDSGLKRGQRTIRGGRRRVRQALYMAAIAAITKNNLYADQYKKLRKTGKPAKVALVAIARKILITANAITRTQTPFNANV